MPIPSLRRRARCRTLLLAIAGLGLSGLAQAADIDITTYGAVGNGTTDNYAAIQRALDDAARNKVGVFVPPGVFAYRGALSADGIRISGMGAASVLHGLDPQNAGLRMRGAGPKVENLKFTVYPPATRGAALRAQRVSFRGASDFLVSNVIVDGSGAGGIYMEHSTNGTVRNSTVMNTKADGIHVTGTSAYITVDNNRLIKTGDDGVAVVSYKSSPQTVHHVVARNNVVKDNVGGRGMSIVGGRDVLYENNHIENNKDWACVYIAQEGNYNTYAASNAVIQYNTTKNCGSNITGHAGLFLVGGGPDFHESIRFFRNRVIQDTSRPGVRMIGAFNRAIVLDSNKLEGVANVSLQHPEQVAQTPYTDGRAGYVAPLTQVLGMAPAQAVASPGTTFRLAYNWFGGPLDRNLKVFVHFVDANGKIFLQDDHVPPLPTTQWNGNANYVRTIAVPASMPRQSYSVLVGLYDPVTGARRTLAAGPNATDAAHLRYRVGSLVVQ